MSPPSDIVIEATPERIERGRYLAENVMACMGCHSVRMIDRFSAPLVEDQKGAGGFIFDEALGIPGILTSRNITPAGLGDWTDGEIVRAITAGVSKDGEALFPLLPYLGYGQLDREDIYAVVAYLRSMVPVAADAPIKALNFPVGLMVRMVPTDPTFSTRPDPSDTVAYGQYLALAAGCSDCHTVRDSRGEDIGPPFAGGAAFRFEGFGISRSANITPDEMTGIGSWTRQNFIDRFASISAGEYRQMEVVPGDFNTLMPWWEYGGMTPDDLGAIYDFLRTVAAATNPVMTFERQAADR